jgi:hypothetical protein
MTQEEIMYLRDKASKKELRHDNQILQKLVRLAKAGIPEWQTFLAEITPGIVG